MSESKDEKNKALGIAISQIEKNFGKGSIMKMGENKKLNVEVIPTGSFPSPISENKRLRSRKP